MQPAAERRPDPFTQGRRLPHPELRGRERPAAWTNETPAVEDLSEQDLDGASADETERAELGDDSKELHTAWNLVNERELTIALLHEELESVEKLNKELTEALCAQQSELAKLRDLAASVREDVTEAVKGLTPRQRTALFLRRVSLGGWSEAYRNLELEFGEDSQFFSGIKLDPAHGGFFVATYRALDPGTMVELDFTTSTGQALRLSGVVAWLREAGSPFGERPGLGIAFSGMSSAARAIIEEVWRVRPPLYVEV